MKCPNNDGELIQTLRRGIQLDRCESCKGTWFDKDELRQAKDETDDDLRWLDFDVFDDAAEKFRPKGESLSCPKCDAPMAHLEYSNSNVVIDRCSNCQGVWLEAQEFVKIIEYLEKLVISQSQLQYKKTFSKNFARSREATKVLSRKSKIS